MHLFILVLPLGMLNVQYVLHYLVRQYYTIIIFKLSMLPTSHFNNNNAGNLYYQKL